MLFTCRLHVANGLKKMNVPHIKRIHHRIGDSCYYCNKKADFKLFFPHLLYRLTRKKVESMYNATTNHHLAFAWQARRYPL